MKKRGISPLIATVFLIGLAILVGSIVFLSSFDSTDKVILIADKWADSKVLKYSASWPSNADCESLCDDESGEIKCFSEDQDKCYCLLIENEELEEVNYNVVTKGTLGGIQVCSPDNFKLGPLESKVFAIAVNSAIVGENSLTAQVSAVQLVDVN